MTVNLAKRIGLETGQTTLTEAEDQTHGTGLLTAVQETQFPVLRLLRRLGDVHVAGYGYHISSHPLLATLRRGEAG